LKLRSRFRHHKVASPNRFRCFLSRPVCPALLLIALWTQSSQAQIFHVQGGSSSLLDAHGGSVEFRAPRYTGSVGAGFINGQFVFGEVLRTQFHGYHLTAGDDVIPFNLPTDVFDSNHYFFGRGLGVSGKSQRMEFAAFGGATSSALGAPYFSAARTEQPFALFFSQFQQTEQLRFILRVIMAEKMTLLGGIEWSPRKWMSYSFSSGEGAGAPYFANAFHIERGKLTFKAAYIGADKNFRRIGAQFPLVSEAYKDNIYLGLRPMRNFSFSLSRQNVLSPVTAGQPSIQGTIHQFGANTSLYGVRLSANLYQSRVSAKDTVGYAFSASRPFGRKLDVGFDSYTSKSKGDLQNKSMTGHIRETITQNLSLTQYVSRSGGQTAFNLGGEYQLSNRFSVALSHETAYLPFRSTTAGGPFVHVYSLSLRFRPFGNLELAANTHVAPDGRIHYTTSVGNYWYGFSELAGSRVPSLKIPKYVVFGKVVDVAGRPLAGVALQVDGKMSFTDSKGEFLVRFPKREKVSFKVSLADFLMATPYSIVAAPTSVETAPEEKATLITVVLQRISDISRLSSPK
jgi:hypothetical protein